MRVRWIGLALLLALLGAAAGYGVGVLTRTEATTFVSAEPVAAVSPSIPVIPTPPFTDDIDYPPLAPDLDYKPHRIGDPPFQWTYDVPRGWVPEQLQQLEVRWRPDGEPTTGGYSLRAKIATDYQTDEQMAAEKEAAVRGIYDDVEVVEDTADLLSFTYRDGLGRKRFNTFQWFTAPGGTTAGLEVSVVGREADVPGLESLLESVAASVRKLPQ